MKKVDQMIKDIETKFKLNENTYQQKNSIIEEIEQTLGFRHASWESFSEPQLQAILNGLKRI